ncbi:hypothetical protein ABIA33_003389 [Streptacidiphilus sp. MAP12-16]|uniref:hypothetical protein n=1 Tax=Streptacidiphilus sp. MAP12-16 TaxID=3156300 RepID=UPI00351233F1
MTVRPVTRPSTVVILGLLLVLAYNLRHLLVPVTAAVVPWVATTPAALLLLLLGALWWRAAHPTTQVRTR